MQGNVETRVAVLESMLTSHIRQCDDRAKSLQWYARFILTGVAGTLAYLIKLSLHMPVG